MLYHESWQRRVWKLQEEHSHNITIGWKKNKIDDEWPFGTLTYQVTLINTGGYSSFSFRDSEFFTKHAFLCVR